MATITRTDLFRALSNVSSEFVSKEAQHKLNAWAYDAQSFTVGGWDKCPLDQVGLVKKFETRGPYQDEENTRFRNEASEIDARILPFLHTDLPFGSVAENLVVRVVG